MMNNPAAPSYFNGGSKQEYLDFRYLRLHPGACSEQHLTITNQNTCAELRVEIETE